jgi:soluble lytic murein transglycosylase-like protein
MIQVVLSNVSIAIKSIAIFMGKICLQPAYLLTTLLLFSQQNAHADVYGFIDEKGVAHFAAERVDARYELFFKGGESFDTQQGITSRSTANGALSGQSAPENTASLAAKDKANSKIQAYFDVSPSFKAVRHHMREAAQTYRIDFELLQALIVAESGFDPLAVSPKGAIGLMQLMPDTAKRFGVNADKKKQCRTKAARPENKYQRGCQVFAYLDQYVPGPNGAGHCVVQRGRGCCSKIWQQNSAL